MVKKLETKAEFDSVVSDPNKYVVVDFTATWCGPCKMIGPKFEAMEAEFPDITFVKVDVDENSEAAEKAEISAMPTFHVYKDGKKVDELVGASEDKLKEMIQKYSTKKE